MTASKAALRSGTGIWVAYFPAICWSRSASEAFCSNRETSSIATDSSTSDSEARIFVDSLETLAKLVDSCPLMEIEVDSLIESEWLAVSERLVEVDREAEAESSEDALERITLSASTNVSCLVSETVGARDATSSAWATVATTAPPNTVPTATKPFNNCWPSLWRRLPSSGTSAMTISSTCPRTTRKNPRAAVDARSQFFPDLINLKRTTRSVSRKFPFERLNCMIYPLYSYNLVTTIIQKCYVDSSNLLPKASIFLYSFSKFMKFFISLSQPFTRHLKRLDKCPTFTR